MNINTIRGNLQSQVQAIYQSGLNSKDTGSIVRGEINSLLDDLHILEKELPTIAGDDVYSETCRHLYSEMLKSWIANTDDIYGVIETIKHCRFGSMSTPLQMWSRLREFAYEVDKRSQPTRKEKFLQTFGIKRKAKWVAEVEAIHPEILESYRKRNAELQEANVA